MEVDQFQKKIGKIWNSHFELTPTIGPNRLLDLYQKMGHNSRPKSDRN